MSDKEILLEKIYNNPSNPAGFGGIDRLYEEAKKKDYSITREDVQHYLEGHRTYSLMRPRRVHFKRVKTIPLGFMSDVQVDLAQMDSLARHNTGFRYILVGIDVLSKRIFATPVKSKKAEDMVEAFKEIISQMPFKCIRIYSDQGKEFTNRLLKEYFDEEEIQKLQTSSTFIKASLAERAIRDLKQRLYRFFAHTKTLNWVNVLDKIVNAMNHSKSRTHGMRPIDVNFKNAQKVWQIQYGKEMDMGKGKEKQKFKPGDFVRMSRGKGLFEKGYIPNWGDEILEIDSVKKRSKPIVYRVKDERGQKFKGAFYKEELAKVRKEAGTTYRIEKVYQKKKRTDGTFDVLVKYVGYPERHWIHESDLQ